MSTSSPSPGPQSARFPLRLPLIAMLGVMTMGSGLGNPGCGSSDDNYRPSPPFVCDDTCDVIAGTYRLAFKTQGPFGDDCERLGMKLPTELVLSRDGQMLKARVSDVDLEGKYYPVQPQHLALWGDDPSRELADGNKHLLRISLDGQLGTVPTRVKEAWSFEGKYSAFRLPREGQPSDGLRCDIHRDFTATRVDTWGG